MPPGRDLQPVRCRIKRVAALTRTQANDILHGGFDLTSSATRPAPHPTPSRWRPACICRRAGPRRSREHLAPRQPGRDHHTLARCAPRADASLGARPPPEPTPNPRRLPLRLWPARRPEHLRTVKCVMPLLRGERGRQRTMSLGVKLIQPNGDDRSTLLAVTASDLADSVQEFTTTLGTRRSYDASENYRSPSPPATPAGRLSGRRVGFRRPPGLRATSSCGTATTARTTAPTATATRTTTRRGRVPRRR